MKQAVGQRKLVAMETMEARRLLAFTPAGAPVIASPVGVAAVESAAGLADGRHVIVWTAGTNVFARLYNGDGTPVAAAVQVNGVGGTASAPDVAIDDTGAFVVTYQQADADGEGVYARQFTGSGAPLSGPVQVNTTATGAQTRPRVAVASVSGAFTVVWQSDQTGSPRIYEQKFNPNGTANGVEGMASDDNDATQGDIQMNASGASVVVWNSATDTLAQRYNAAGVAQGGLITVAGVTDSQPAVGMATDGDFVIAWSVDEPGPGIARDVMVRRYNNAGSAVGGAFNAASDATGDEQFPVIDVSGAGKFVVGWAEASTTPGTFDLASFRAFTAGAASLGPDTSITAVQYSAANRFGVVWRDTQPVRAAYASGNQALIQEFQNQLVIDLGNSNNVLSIYGSPSIVRVNENGSVTDYSSDLFTSIVVNGGTGNDYIRSKNLTVGMTVFGNEGNDTIIGSAVDDHLEGGLGNDLISGGAGNDYINGNDEQDTLYGANGNDTLTGGPGRNLMYGEDGDDLLGGGNRPDSMYGGPGNDRLLGRAGGDGLLGGNGNDTLDGGEGNDGLLGENGDDSLIGGNGNDTLRGGRNDDRIFGGAAIDVLYGDSGADLLDGGTEGDYGYYDVLDSLISIEIRRPVP